MPWRLALAVALVVAFAAPSHATVWRHKRADGTVEYTNIAPRGEKWQSEKDHKPEVAVLPAPIITSSSPVGGAMWTRTNRDGSLEFTNITPAGGGRWKVLFRTGPGKAASVRGATDIVPPRDRSPERFSRYDQHIRDQQEFYGIPQALIRAVIKTESDYDPRVVSSAGAQGLMQLMPGTAKMMGVSDVWDPRQNIMGGARYLQVLAKRFCRTPASGELVCSADEKVKVLAGYHAGPGAVEKYGGLPPYETTRAYVTTVLQRYEELRRRETAVAANR